MGVAAAGADQRIAVYGALDYASGRLVWQTASHKDGTGFAAFLEQIAQTWPQEDLVLVLDNVSYQRSAAMRPWWTAQKGRLLPFWLPAYTPNLNLLERVWYCLKQKLACHRCWADRDRLYQATTTLLQRTTAYFHSPSRPSVRLTHNFCQTA